MANNSNSGGSSNKLKDERHGKLEGKVFHRKDETSQSSNPPHIRPLHPGRDAPTGASSHETIPLPFLRTVNYVTEHACYVAFHRLVLLAVIRYYDYRYLSRDGGNIDDDDDEDMFITYNGK